MHNKTHRQYPDGLRISEFIRKNLADLQYVEWEDGERGYNPEDLNITRFGLDAGFIKEHNLTWIENLITGSGKNLASPTHKNHHLHHDGSCNQQDCHIYTE